MPSIQPKAKPPKPLKASLGRPTTESAAELTERIVATASRLFVEKGYAQTSMNEVSRVSGASKRTVATRFPTKEALARAVFAHFHAANFAREEEIGHGDMRDRLIWLGMDLLRINLAPEITAIYLLMMAEPTELGFLMPVMEEVWVSVRVRVGRALEAAVQAGTIRLPDLTQATSLFNSLVIGSPFVRATMGDRMAEPDRLGWVTAAVDLFLDGCRVVARPGDPRVDGRAER